MRVCVYTTIYGEYDPLREQVEQSVPTDFICFTESEGLAASKPWSIIVNKDRPDFHPRMRAKYLKILNHRVFPEGRLSSELLRGRESSETKQYDYTIFVDASVQIQSPDFVKMMISHIPDKGWAMLIHPERDCIYPEVAESLRVWPKKYGPPYRLQEQIEKYRTEGYPEKNGLFATTIIARRSDDTTLPEIQEIWWKEIVEYSPQCQVSLPVVLWRMRATPVTPVNVYLWHNEFFQWIRHTRDD